VQQTVGSSVTNYLWDEASTYGDVVQETDGNGVTQASYVLGDDELLAQTRSGTVSYYLYDGQNNVRLLTDANGAITDSYRYDAFGTALSSQGTTINPYRYTGQQLDSLTGLYDLRARYYDPTSGRFLSRDTASLDFSNPVELNRYTYVADNPINFADPSGQFLVETAKQEEVTVPAEEEILPPESSFIERLLVVITAVLYFYHLLAPGAGPVPLLPPGPTLLPLPAPTPVQLLPHPDDKRGFVVVFREVGGNKNNAKTQYNNVDLKERQFRPRPQDRDGLSTTEEPRGFQPYMVALVIFYIPPKRPYITGFVLGAPCAGTFTPYIAPGHWSINCVGTPGVALSQYARRYCNSVVFLNPAWKEEPQKRLLDCSKV